MATFQIGAYDTEKQKNTTVGGTSILGRSKDLDRDLAYLNAIPNHSNVNGYEDIATHIGEGRIYTLSRQESKWIEYHAIIPVDDYFFVIWLTANPEYHREPKTTVEQIVATIQLYH